MMKLRRLGLAFLLVAAAVWWTGFLVSAQTGETFKVRLTTVPIDATMMSRIAGAGSATATLTGKKLLIVGVFSGLPSAATDAHLHRGPRGIRGPAIIDLTVPKATNGNINTSIELTSDQVEDLRNSRLYLQINSERAPDGNLWGWLLR